MRKVHRTAVPPPSLVGAGSAGGLELVRARTRFGPQPTRTGKFTFDAYKCVDVRDALEDLFHGKCAYCEAIYTATGPVDIEHFRPKGGVDGDALHPGYWWLAASWKNLLPSCPDCNRRRFQRTPGNLSSLSGLLEAQKGRGLKAIKTGKKTCFPIRGDRIREEPAATDLDGELAREDALLLDPCTDDPSQHIKFYTDPDNPIGIVFAAPDSVAGTGALPALSSDVQEIEREARAANVSVKGAISIQIYGLNRLGLVQERTRVLQKLEYHAGTVINLSRALEKAEARRLVARGLDDDDLVLHIKEQVRQALVQIRNMAGPKAPFSMMAQTWIRAFGLEVGAASTTAQHVEGQSSLLEPVQG